MLNRKRGWTHVAFVASQNDEDVQYEIKAHEDGRMGCACHAWAFSPSPKLPCKHLLAFQQHVPTARGRKYGDTPEDYAVPVVVRGETLVVSRRRGISFGPVTSASVRQ
jgi:hypothetical protein